MASTSVPSRRGATPARSRERPPAPSTTPRRQRRWSLALVSILVTVGSALTFALLWVNAGNRQPVLAVARPVPAGQVIEAADLAVVRVSAEAGVVTVAAERRSSVVGQSAANDLMPGALLVDGQWGGAPMLADGDVVLGVPVPSEQLPSGGLQAGDRVLVVLTAPPGAPVAGGATTGVPPGSLGQVLTEARVFASGPPSESSSTAVLSLALSRAAAPDVAGASAAGRVSLVLVPEP